MMYTIHTRTCTRSAHMFWVSVSSLYIHSTYPGHSTLFAWHIYWTLSHINCMYLRLKVCMHLHTHIYTFARIAYSHWDIGIDIDFDISINITYTYALNTTYAYAVLSFHRDVYTGTLLQTYYDKSHLSIQFTALAYFQTEAPLKKKKKKSKRYVPYTVNIQSVRHGAHGPFIWTVYPHARTPVHFHTPVVHPHPYRQPFV